MKYTISNLMFLQAIFGEDYEQAHVTSFHEDPGSIPNDRRGIAWAGGYYRDYKLQDGANQFYTVSIFEPDILTGKSKRRKANFKGCYVIGLDDVREKLPIEQVNRLPPPSIILKSSNHSEQWLYILDVPETDRNRLDNLHDQLIANGLAPDGTDPGQKGVTRYLRLPEGFNLKFKRIEENGGVAPQCEVTGWNPERRYTMEQLAEPFDVDLDAARSDARIDGAAEIADHPVLSHLKIKSVLSAGRYDVTCPWVDTHTDKEDNGAAVFTNSDGSIGFQCHHGHCQDKTAKDLLEVIEQNQVGFTEGYKTWQMFGRDLGAAAVVPAPPGPLDFMQPVVAAVPPINVNDVMVKLDTLEGPERLKTAENLLKVINALDSPTQKIEYLANLRKLMSWTKGDVKNITKSFEQHDVLGTDEQWLIKNGVVVTNHAGGIYNLDRKIMQTVASFNLTYSHLNLGDMLPAQIVANAPDKLVADGLGWTPDDQEMFTYNGKTFINTYAGLAIQPKPGDVTDWLTLMNFICGDQTKLVLQHMAFTLQRPTTKIRWQILWSGTPRTGKTMCITPIISIFGEAGCVIGDEEFDAGWGDMYANKKVAAFEEVWRSDPRHFNSLKTKLANNDIESLNIKGQGILTQRNVLSIYMLSNHPDALQFKDNDDKILVINVADRFLSTEFYKSLGERIDNDKDYLAGICHYLMNLDISDFEHGRLPVRTKAMYEMVHNSRPDFAILTDELLEDEVIPAKCFKFDMLQTALADKNVRFSRKGLSHYLHEQGFTSYKGQDRAQTPKSIRFWSNDKSCKGMRSADLRQFYNENLFI